MKMRITKRFSAILLLLSIIIGLAMSNVTTAEASYSENIILNVPWTLINECGNQYEQSGHKYGCQAYSFAYCRIVLDNQAHKWTDYRAKNSEYLAVSFAAAGYSNEHSLSKQEVLKAVYDNINSGRPVILNVVSQYTSGHYVVAIGYKADCNPDAIKESDIIIIDPANRNIISTAGTNENYTNLGDTYSLKCNTNNHNLYQYGIAKSGGVAVNSAGNPINGADAGYTVTFDPNGGSVYPTTKTLAKGTLLTGMPTPTRNGYTFIGWAMDKIDPDGKGVSSTVIVADGVWTFDKDTTLYAHWTRDKHTHTNGAYFYSDNHPHYKYYTCTTCGEVYTDGSTTNMSSCSICNTSSNDFPLFSDGVYTLAPLCALGSRLDVAGADWRDNANVQIHESNGTLAQQWELTYVGDGYYQLVCKASGKALDVSQAGTEPGTNVQQFEPNGTIAQQWRIETAADGSYFLIPRVNTNLRLDVSGAGNANGTNVQIYTANGTTAQMWDFTFADSSPTSNSGSSVSVPQYFSCNVGIFTVKGKTVNLYNNPGDSKRVDYFSLGQSVGSSYGVNMPDGTTWYQVSVTSKGNVITVWLKYESGKMTVKNL